MSTICGTKTLPRRGCSGTGFALSTHVKSLVAGTAVTILLLAGATQIPPSTLPDLADSVKSRCSSLLPGQRASNERLAGTVLKTLASAQADFRANDRDRDGVQQFWRGDVAGLYLVSPPGGNPIQLIEREAAAADDRPLPTHAGRIFRRPYHGYWFRAIRHADETPNRLDPQRFAFVAFPVNRTSGLRMLIVDENNSLRGCSVDGFKGLDVMPTDDELRSKWFRAG